MIPKRRLKDSRGNPPKPVSNQTSQVASSPVIIQQGDRPHSSEQVPFKAATSNNPIPDKPGPQNNNSPGVGVTSSPKPSQRNQPVHATQQTSKKTTNAQFTSDLYVERPGFLNVGDPATLTRKLESVGYQCLPYLAVQLGLALNVKPDRVRSVLLEGPSGCGKSFLVKALAKIAGAELLCLSCYRGMPTDHLIEVPSSFALAQAMAGRGEVSESVMNLGILSRAFLLSQEKPVVLLVDELDKPDSAIDTFFLGPIQDSRIWLESRPPIDANIENLIIIFTKNLNRKLDEALLRRVHPIVMTYLDATLEKKILSPHCHPQLVSNLVMVADRMRNSGGSYSFQRPPAPEELLTAGQYITRLLEWGMTDFAFVGQSIWNTIAKSEHDRAVLEHMMRYHPDFMDPLVPDSKNASTLEIYARFGRILLSDIIEDPDRQRRAAAWDTEYS